MKHRPQETIRFSAVLRGYARGFLGAAIVVLLAAAAVWPVWYIATAHTGLYTVLSLIVLSAGLLYLVISRSIRRRGEASLPEVKQAP